MGRAPAPGCIDHLAPGERVLWQGHPKPGSVFGPGVIAAGLGLVMVVALLIVGLAGSVLTPEMRFAAATASVLAGLVILDAGLRRRASLWSYAVTDRRLIRSLTPEQLDRLTLTIRGNTLYWFRIHPNQSHAYDRSHLAGPGKCPYAPELEWNTLQVKAGPEAGLVLIIADAPMTRRLEDVVHDRLSKTTGATIIEEGPAYIAGPFKGFGVTRTLPRGAQIRSNAALSALAMLYQFWLEGEGLCLEIEGYALEGQTKMHRAMKAMSASLDFAA